MVAGYHVHLYPGGRGCNEDSLQVQILPASRRIKNMMHKRGALLAATRKHGLMLACVGYLAHPHVPSCIHCLASTSGKPPLCPCKHMSACMHPHPM
jgi:hypothetical protein